MKTIQIYINKRGIMGPWFINPMPKKKFDQVVVIPAFAELQALPQTIRSLNLNKYLKNTLVIIVVNNDKKSSNEVKTNNKFTINMLEKINTQFTLGIIDASSEKLQLPMKYAGVGMARKIGIDLALPHLLSSKSLIFCLDADTIVEKQYLEITKNFFSFHKVDAAVMGFKHIKPKDIKQIELIDKYEEYLITTAKKIDNTGSPYGYVSMGSTMVCTVKAYCAIGGMPKKKATEDFYFLQELAKFCGIHKIPQILVHPSARPISRVYLGTGFRMKEAQNGFDIDSLYFSDNAFNLLSKWIRLGSKSWNIDLNDLNKKNYLIHPKLPKFLFCEGIEKVWTNINFNAPSEYHFTTQFHCWFDGLRTIRFLKYFSKI